MSRRAGVVIGAALVLTLALAGCQTRPVVGVLLPKTGSSAEYGASIESGITLALDDARQAKLLPSRFDVVWEDTASDPGKAVAALERLARDHGVHLVIGGATSGEAKALLPELDRVQVVCLSPTASLPSLTKGSKLFFRVYPSEALEGSAAGQFAFKRLKRESVLLYVGDNEYSRGIEPEFVNQYQKLGGTVVGRVELASAGWQQKSRVLLDQTRPSAVYVIGYAPEILAALRHLHEAGYSNVVLTTSAFDSSNTRQEAGPLAEGVIFPSPPFDRTSDKEPIRGFVSRYQQKYKRPPDILAAHGYDAMRVAIEVMTLARPPEVAEIKQALHFGIKDFTGVTGPILFGDDGDVKHYPRMYIVSGGKVGSYQQFVEGERNRVFTDILGQQGASKTPAAPGS